MSSAEPSGRTSWTFVRTAKRSGGRAGAVECEFRTRIGSLGSALGAWPARLGYLTRLGEQAFEHLPIGRFALDRDLGESMQIVEGLADQLARAPCASSIGR